MLNDDEAADVAPEPQAKPLAAPLSVDQDTLAIVTGNLMTRLDYPWSDEAVQDCLAIAYDVCLSASAWAQQPVSGKTVRFPPPPQ